MCKTRLEMLSFAISVVMMELLHLEKNESELEREWHEGPWFWKER